MVLRGKFIAIQTYLKKKFLKQPNITLKGGRKRTTHTHTKTKPTRRKEIIKIRAEINDIETKKNMLEQIIENRRWLFEKNQQN